MEGGRDDFVIAFRSALLKKGTQQRFSILSLILFSIILLILGHFNFKIIKLTRSVIKDIVYTSSFITSIPENLVKNSYNGITSHFNHYDEFKNVKKNLNELKSKDLSKEIITLENIKLKKLIEDYFIKDNETYAKVLIDKQSPFLRSIILNKGSKNGIKVGMVVLDDIYLIGKVVEVNHLTSRVLLISDINSKVPVSLEPIDIQAIMSGTGKKQASLQYLQNDAFIDELNKNDKEFIVLTSGAGAVFQSGIPIGTISKNTIENSKDIVINFYKDFSQLKYVKVLSYEENSDFDSTNKKKYQENKSQVEMIADQAENFRILQKQKNIDDEIREKFEVENTSLKEKLINTQKKLKGANKQIEEFNKKVEKIEFLELNLLYGHKCRKTFYNKLYKPGSPEYKKCVLAKGKVN